MKREKFLKLINKLLIDNSNRIHQRSFLFFGITLFFVSNVFSLQIIDSTVKTENRSLAFIDPSGKYIARTEPEFPFELTQKGETTIYEIVNGDDFEVYNFDWYCKNIYMAEFDGVLYTARVNSAHYGILASKKDTCLSLYKKDRLIKHYTTLDFSEQPNNVDTYSGFYTVIKKVNGFFRGDFPYNNHKLVFSFYVKGFGKIWIDLADGKIIDRYSKCDIAKSNFDPSMLIYRQNPEEN